VRWWHIASCTGTGQSTLHLHLHPVHRCSGWAQALVLWNFVLCCAMLLQKFIVVWGLGGLMPGKCCVCRAAA
jgi:hypothetical protein